MVKAVTIQVKTSTHHTEKSDPEGSKWGKWVEWWIPDYCPADYIATVDLDRQRFWLIKTEKFKCMGARSGNGTRLWWYVPEYEPERAKNREELFENYEMVKSTKEVFGL
ncbi:MAG: hypothetical protein IIB11_01085 [Chloroflexi bacterium]|nr:hypothetical protein [Chloroflexota bacterium]